MAPWEIIFKLIGVKAKDKLKGRIENVSWWNDVANTADTFPSSPNVYHWNPVAFVEQMILLTSDLITMEMITTSGAKGDTATLDQLLIYINTFAKLYEINTPLRIAHFLSQVGHESGFKVISENLNYSQSRMQEVFDAPVSKTDATHKYKDLWDHPNKYAHKPENLGNYVYANRMSNSDFASGDGYKYRGRGLIQLTGKGNYQSFSNEHNKRFPDDQKDFVKEPDLIITNTRYGVESAFAWWTFNGVNSLCTGGTKEVVKKVTKRVNNGYKGLDERLEHFKAIFNLLEGKK